MRSPILLVVHGALALGACSLGACEDARAAREREQLARFPLGEIVEDGDDPVHDPRPFPPSLHLLAPALGRGVFVALEVARPDGAHDAPRWGMWTYEYVRTESKVSPTGEANLCFGSIEETSTGLEAQGEYARDVPAGLWRFWYPDGKPRAEGSFNEGKPSGEWKFWFADGQPDTQQSGLYRNGELTQDARR
jgi:hypothetical protein